jgi:CheY-like chemotaxis protein
MAQTIVRRLIRGRPLLPANSPVASSGVRSAALEHYPAPRVLLADGHRDTCDMYAVWLTQRGFLVSAAASASEIEALAGIEPVDVIVTELILPGGGTPMLRALRANPATADAVVIVVTTQNAAPLREQALAAGADCYLVKPCSAARLGEAMASSSRARFREAVPTARQRDVVLRAAQRAFAIRERVACAATSSSHPAVDCG